MIEKKGCIIRGWIVPLILALALPGVVQAADTVEGARPAMDSTVIGSLRPGKTAPLISQSEDRLAGLRCGRFRTTGTLR